MAVMVQMPVVALLRGSVVGSNGVLLLIPHMVTRLPVARV